MADTVKKSSLLTVARKMTPLLSLIPVVELISIWAFYCAFLHYRQAAEAIYGRTMTQPRLPALTGTAAVATTVVNYVQLWCSILQGVAGVLVPLLHCRRRSCWVLAFVALAATVANQCIWGMIQGILLVVNPGDRLSIFGVLTAIGVVALELPAFVVLFLGADQEIYYKQI